MSIDIRLPNITAPTTEGQMAQMQSYMHQLVEQLNWALNTVSNAQSGDASNIVIEKQDKDISPEEAEDTFNSIKALIIKSADIVRAYEQTMRTTYNGEYVAVSDFGTYMEKTNKTVEENSKYTNEIYTNVQTITNESGDGRLDTLESEVKEANAYIKRGLLDYDENGKAIVGIEIGETAEDGAFIKCARFRGNRLSFYDVNSTEVAYIGAEDMGKDDTNCLYIRGRAIFQSEVLFNGYKADTTDGLAFTWVGG